MSLNPQPVAEGAPADSALAPAPTPPQGGAARVRIRLWDLPTRLFHWLLVAAVLTAVITGQIGGGWMRVHGIAGLGIVGLVVFRLLWGVIGPAHARFASFAPTPSRVWAYVRGRWQGVGHNPLGALSVIALLVLLGAQATTGLFANDDIDFTGPWAASISDALSSRLTGWHHQLADALLILIGLHVLAIVFYAAVKKDNLVKPMLTGDKEVEAGPRPADEPPRAGWRGGRISVVIALAVAGLAVYGANGPVRFGAAAAPSSAAPAQAASAAKPGW